MGYPYEKKAWKLYVLEKNEFFSSRDVIFQEDQFSGTKGSEYITPPVFKPNLTVDD